MKNSIKSCLLAAALFLLGACEESKTELPDAPAPVITADTPQPYPPPAARWPSHTASPIRAKTPN